MLRFSFLFFIFTVSLHAVSCACTIPVFRYALDRWEADKFHLVLPAGASSDVALTDALRPLRANGKANLEITTAKDAAAEAVLYSSRESEKVVWRGTMDQAALASLLDSPGRQQILQQILAGDSAVWVIAEGSTPEDKAEVERIEKRLKFLEQVASLPIQDPNDPDSQLGPGPALKLKFATLRLRRDDPAEKLLLAMLAGPKNEFDPTTTSFAAAVFGKGRVLGAWPLTDLDDASLEDACMFLVGRCGCRVKSGNPGWDLLLNVDWEKALAAATKPTEVTAAPVEMKKPEAVVTKAAEQPTAAAAADVADPRMNSTLLIGGATLLAALAFFFLRGAGKK
jgi:hypothetical protein